jgi:hypothetical protein
MKLDDIIEDQRQIISDHRTVSMPHEIEPFGCFQCIWQRLDHRTLLTFAGVFKTADIRSGISTISGAVQNQSWARVDLI